MKGALTKLSLTKTVGLWIRTKNQTLSPGSAISWKDTGKTKLWKWIPPCTETAFEREAERFFSGGRSSFLWDLRYPCCWCSSLNRLNPDERLNSHPFVGAILHKDAKVVYNFSCMSLPVSDCVGLWLI